MPDSQSFGSEEAIIQEFLAPLAAGYAGAFGLTDDCAAFTPTPGHDLVVKTDPVASGVHFLSSDAPEHIGWKALAVNVSDLAAKAAVPRAYLMALSFPEAPARDWMRRFATGLGDAQSAFGLHLIGGDTDRRPGPVTISITVLGEVPAGRMVRRGTARPGDLIYVTGSLGAAAFGLALRTEMQASAEGFGRLLARWNVEDDVDTWFPALDAYLRPKPRIAIREALRTHATAAMDLSDGLAKDLGRMCKASRTGATVMLADVPLEAIVRSGVAAEPGRWQDVVAAGDDYEVLAAVAPGDAAAFEAMAHAAGQAAEPPFRIARIGVMTAGATVDLIAPDGSLFVPERTGWDHF